MKKFIVTISVEGGDHYQWEVPADSTEQAQTLAQADIDTEEPLRNAGAIIESVN